MALNDHFTLNSVLCWYSRALTSHVTARWPLRHAGTLTFDLTLLTKVWWKSINVYQRYRGKHITDTRRQTT